MTDVPRNAPPSFLVVNADDGGLHAHTDAAILSAARNGLLTSVSIVANGPTVESFVPRAIDAGLGIGLHFNLSQGAPLATGLDSLTDESGVFLCSRDLTCEPCAWRRFEPEEVASEARAQWLRLVDLGAEADHLDGHNHVHLLPTVREGLRRALGGERLYVRVPSETECPDDCLPLPLAHGELLEAESSRRPAAWRCTDRFVGLLFSHKPQDDGIQHLLQTRPGVTEWMTHPGSRPGSPFTSSDLRDQEARFLCQEEARRVIESRGYRLVRFGDVP